MVQRAFYHKRAKILPSNNKKIGAGQELHSLVYVYHKYGIFAVYLLFYCLNKAI
jgi:hypothetical protein